MPRKQQIREIREPVITSEMLAGCIAEGMSEKKGVNIVLMDMRKVSNRVADFFVICEGTSVTHVEALADYVEEIARKEYGAKPSHVEGMQQRQWVLLDFFDVVAHVFTESSRSFFRLEELWADAEITRLEA